MNIIAPLINTFFIYLTPSIKAAAICGVAFTPRDYYHNVKDTYTNLNPECIRIVRDILKDSVSMFSKVGKIF